MAMRNHGKILVFMVVIGFLNLTLLFDETRNFLASKIFAPLSLGTQTDYEPVTALSMSTQPDLEWVKARESLLSQHNPSKIFILAYGRGGSTLCGDIFNIDHDDFIFWFEPLKGIYSHLLGYSHFNGDFNPLFLNNFTLKPSGERHVNEMTDHVNNLLTCNVNDIPTEVLSIDFFNAKSQILSSFNRCMKTKNAFKVYGKCQEYISPYCDDYRLLGPKKKLLRNYSLASMMDCKDILRSIRRWKLTATLNFSKTELLFRFLQESNKTQLKEAVYDSCLKLRTKFDLFERNWAGQAGKKSKPLINFLQDIDTNWNCFLFEEKFNNFLLHYECMENLNRKTLLCRKEVTDICERIKSVAIKVLRVMLADVEPLLKRMPDVHIVHYVRDPRAIVISRLKSKWRTFRDERNWTIEKDSKALCTKMRYDLESSKRLQRIYPGSIVTVRYEDLVLDPRKTVKKMFDHFGRPVPKGLDKWINRTLHASKNNGNYGVIRSKGAEHLSEWRSKVNADRAATMSQYCEDIIREYGYNL